MFPRKKSKVRRQSAPRKPSGLSRLINDWWDRLISAVLKREFGSSVELYAAHSTTRDYIWNSLGMAAWGSEFPFLTIIVTQLVGAEQAGMFSMAYVTGMMLMYLGNYGVRTFQVSDINEEQSFAAYQITRVITSLLMCLVGGLWIVAHGYNAAMTTICIGVYGFRMIDGVADVYEGRLQQHDKLYLAGISTGVRSAGTLVIFSILLFVTRNLPLASLSLLVVSLATLILVTIPLAWLETPKSRSPRAIEVREILVQCFPAAAALFLYAVIDNMPKFAMEGMLSYDNQLYYNAIYFPAHIIIMVIGFIYKPQLVKLANVWNDPNGRRRFDIIIFALLGVTAAITVGVGVFMGILGIKMLDLMYGLEFEPMAGLIYAMVLSGGLAAAIDFLYQIITVLRHQDDVTRIYLIALVASVPISYGLVFFLGLAGAIYAAVVTMGGLFVLLAIQYFHIRRNA